ncbi:MAG: PKD domain-containing protein [Thermoplasmatota archaeon]
MAWATSPAPSDGSRSTGTITRYTWDFGDGFSSSQQSPTHTYDEPGTYLVTLQVTNGQGQSDSSSQLVSVGTCPTDPPVSPQAGTHPGGPPRDGVSDEAAGADSDGDGTRDALDDCPHVANADQADQDHDGMGDLCDPDVDGDGVGNDIDDCRDVADPSQSDLDHDAVGDACDPDRDGDGVMDVAYDCVASYDPPQADADFDGKGDVCEAILPETVAAGPAGIPAPDRRLPAIEVADAAAASNGTAMGGAAALAVAALVIALAAWRRRR